uniref:E2 NEDD8-conjugating enzyme n=1 Tax=Caligus rogercresseyi TaxID=217165 RepID=C1BPB6_CALRO|nr:NEDD8-conjugating enzyme UBE2F [Caligus rogercresseyi]|eukprot:TRINITY_DN1050_c0_g1_i1.p1 TRINITY_DN1050_c0_g1~~TRINITY_DN1050_c0_g1_i1.p1  ORF type:complete len:185 (+),score=49.02 TRINITY_DN1050_c0_g1_i1:135-689(+)
MISLAKRLREKDVDSSGSSSSSVRRRVSIRDQLLVKEVAEVEENLPLGSSITFEDPNVLHEFLLSIRPEEGSFWEGGTFHFKISIGEDYNIVPPSVLCLTRLWHPNINEVGDVCLSILRQNSLDGLGWAPTRRLKDVIWGLCSLFSDLLNFEDPLNSEAAEHYALNKEEFRVKVKEYVQKYAKR